MFVKPATTLSWAPGLNAQSHTVYIGDNFDDVNNATGGTTQSEPDYTPEAPLETGKVYYWRVDEFDGKDTHKGDIWSFETPPFTEVIDPNLVGWWKLDGEYLDLGYVFDYSGYNHHGTLGGDPQLIEGHVGNALEFDGVDDYVNIDEYKGINAIDGVQQPFSVANWFRIAPGASDDNVEMVTWGTSAGQQRLTWRVHQGRLRTEHASGNLRGNTYVDDDEWHHGALVVTEGANLRVPATRLYVDGMEDTTFSGSDNTYNLTAGADVRIGMSGPQNGRYWPGSIDDVQLYDKVLTDNEVKIIAGLLESTNPDPADGAKIVDTLAILTWSPGPYAAEFDVYFGTNPEPGAAELVGRVGAATHIATDLAEGQTYYWRVDDVEADGTTIHTGNLWSLWIPPKGAYNPNPADGQEVTDIDADLNWDVDWSPVMSVVHFGTDADEVANAPEGFGPPLMEPGFDPGTLELGTTYYWRVDTFYGTWVISPIWSFSTPTPEAPANLLANGSFEEDEPILDDPDWVQWCTWNPAEGAGSNTTIVDTDAADGSRSLKVEPVGVENWHFILVNISFAADLSKNYTASFWAKADAARPLTVQMKASDNSVDAWNATGFDLTTDWAEYSYTSEVLHTDVKLEFLCAGSDVPFLLDLVSVSEAK
jgi:hypothetical protein